MALTRLQLGELYTGSGGQLTRRFLGCILHMTQQIIGGGYATPTAEQTAWANAVVGSTKAEHEAQARLVLEWGLDNNSTLQDEGEAAIDDDLDFITAEYAKTYGG